MNYKAVLADLRWLETQMRVRGAGCASVRNIIYRDIGTAADRGTLQPLLGLARDHPDLRQARELLDSLIRSSEKGNERDTILLFDIHLSRDLAEPAPVAAREWVARAMRAEVQLRAGNPGDALGDLNRAHTLLRRALGDPALTPVRAGVWRAVEQGLTADRNAWKLQGARAGNLAHLRPGDVLWLLELGGSQLP